MNDAFSAGSRFVLRQARLLEQRLFLTHFGGDSIDGVLDALAGYQNQDGGFGHALEPDTCCPLSLPIYVEVALQSLLAAGARGNERALAMAGRAADYLERVAEEAGAGGAVPLAFPVIESFPRAAHWTDWTYQPALNPTAGIVGLLYALGLEHPWRDRATAWCWRAIEAGGVPEDPHAISEMLVFLEHVPDSERAERAAQAIAGHFAAIPGIHLDPDAPGYGLSPLHFAPSAAARWRGLFADTQIEADLDHLLAAQQPDGGWPISWEPPSEASQLAWRGSVTVQALRTLTSYGRLPQPEQVWPVE